MSMTIQEKKEIMRSLHAKVDARIKQIQLEHPLLEQQVFDKAKENIRKRHALKTKLAAFQKKMEQLNTLKSQIEDDFVTILAQVSYSKQDDIRNNYSRYGGATIGLDKLKELTTYIDQAMNHSIQPEADLVMGETEIGRELLMLREQKKQIDDAVWLATSTAKIYPLYQQVSVVTKTPITPLLESGVKANQA